MADMPKEYGVYASGLTDASGTPFASIQIRRGTKEVPSFERRQVYVGDTLPEGNVTNITAEGITVLPDEGDEYVLPVGSGARVDYSGRKKTLDRVLDTAPLLNQVDFGDADADSNEASTDKDVPSTMTKVLDLLDPMRPRALRNPDGSIDAEGTAAALANPTIYKDVPKEGYQDAAQTDFMEYQSDPAGKGVVKSSSYEDMDLGVTIHRFERDDGIDVMFAETPSGQLYNVTDVIKPGN